jgi:DNA polymerase III alpha subunit (gram-positive type)
MNSTAFLSFDIETDGPSPILNSMLSLGIALITNDGNVIDTLSVNIKKRDESKEDENTMKWWKTQPIAWEKCHQNMVSPQEAMTKVAEFYRKWISNYKLIWIAAPVCFDWMFLKSYYMTFAPADSIDIGFKATDISTLRDYSIKCKIITDKEYQIMTSTIPKGEEHVAIEDAINQGLIFVNLTKLIQNKATMNQKKQKQ